MLSFKVHQQYITTSTRDLVLVCRELQSLFKERTLLLLEGPVGAGKTELVKALAKQLGIFDPASPSFAIHYHYENETYSMDHVDLYRLESEDDLESTGFWDLFSEKKGLIIVEWAERLNEDLLPMHWHKIKVRIRKLAADNERDIQISVQS